jgi:hypothetical protein
MMRMPTWPIIALALSLSASSVAAQDGDKPKAAEASQAAETARAADTAEPKATPERARAKPPPRKARRVRVDSTVRVIDPKRAQRDMKDIISQLRSRGARRAAAERGNPRRARPTGKQAEAAAQGNTTVERAKSSGPRQIKLEKAHAHGKRGKAHQGPVKRDRSAREVRRTHRRDLRGLRGTRAPGPMSFPPHHTRRGDSR